MDKKVLEDMKLYGAEKEGQAFYNITMNIVESEIEKNGTFDIERLVGNIRFNELARLEIPNPHSKIVDAIKDYEDDTDCFENEENDSKIRYAYKGIQNAIEDLIKKYKVTTSNRKEFEFRKDSYYQMETLTLSK